LHLEACEASYDTENEPAADNDIVSESGDHPIDQDAPQSTACTEQELEAFFLTAYQAQLLRLSSRTAAAGTATSCGRGLASSACPPVLPCRTSSRRWLSSAATCSSTLRTQARYCIIVGTSYSSILEHHVQIAYMGHDNVMLLLKLFLGYTNQAALRLASQWVRYWLCTQAAFFCVPHGIATRCLSCAVRTWSALQVDKRLWLQVQR
jgi:hypothetical protein